MFTNSKKRNLLLIVVSCSLRKWSAKGSGHCGEEFSEEGPVNSWRDQSRMAVGIGPLNMFNLVNNLNVAMAPRVAAQRIKHNRENPFEAPHTTSFCVFGFIVNQILYNFSI